MGNRGFTFIEVLSALIIISIISAIALSRIGISNAELTAMGEVVKSHLRYAQLRSMNSESVWGISCDGTDYWLFMDGNTGNHMILPGEDSDPVALSDKNISMAAFTVSFDSWGRPYNNASASGASSGSTITITSPGSSSVGVTITAETGFIP
jgi:prepilin-type N-terminal cleavage/methylation domain-containing protein